MRQATGDWPLRADIYPLGARGERCANCERTYEEALDDQRRLAVSARGTVRDELGHVAMTAVCDLCLMPLGYQVQAETADPLAPTEPQRGFARNDPT